MAGSGTQEASTTMVFAKLLRNLMRDKGIGRRVVPIIPDEARTFGMEALFKEVGIYAPHGQLYEPVDSEPGAVTTARRRTARSSRRASPRPARGFVPGRGHHLRHARRADDAVLHVLLDVRLPACRRPALGVRRRAGPRLPARRHGRPHDAERRGAAARGRPQPCCSPRPSRTAGPTIRRSPTRPRSSSRDGLRRMSRTSEDVFYYLALYNENYVMPALPEGSATGHRGRDLPLRPGSEAGQGRASSDADRIRLDHAAGPPGAGAPRRALRPRNRPSRSSNQPFSNYPAERWIFHRVLDQLCGYRVADINPAMQTEQHQQVEDVRQLVGNRRAAGRVAADRDRLVTSQPAETAPAFSNFAGQRHRDVFGSVERFPTFGRRQSRGLRP